MSVPPDPGGEPIRLHVLLARRGIASRRTCERLIAEGRVKVDGEIVSTPGTKVSGRERITLDGREIGPESARVYLVVNKPAGYLCTAHDPQGRAVVFDLIAQETARTRLFTVGRLDMFSSGLIILTDDGDFAASIGHPSRGVEKEYVVNAGTPIPESLLEDFLKGIEIEGSRYRAKRVRRIGERGAAITLVEGKNREIRVVFAAYHVPIVSLSRVRIGVLTLDDIPEGGYRHLAIQERDALLGLANRGGECGEQG